MEGDRNDDAYTCAICQDTFSPPVVSLTCLHKFCQQCCERTFKDKDEIECPLCKLPCAHKHVKVDHLFTKHLEKHLEEFPTDSDDDYRCACKKRGLYRCKDCPIILCYSCKCSHTATPSLQHHVMDKIQDVVNEVKDSIQGMIRIQESVISKCDTQINDLGKQQQIIASDSEKYTKLLDKSEEAWIRIVNSFFSVKRDDFTSKCTALTNGLSDRVELLHEWQKKAIDQREALRGLLDFRGIIGNKDASEFVEELKSNTELQTREHMAVLAQSEAAGVVSTSYSVVHVKAELQRYLETAAPEALQMDVPQWQVTGPHTIQKEQLSSLRAPPESEAKAHAFNEQAVHTSSAVSSMKDIADSLCSTSSAHVGSKVQPQENQFKKPDTWCGEDNFKSGEATVPMDAAAVDKVQDSGCVQDEVRKCKQPHTDKLNESSNNSTKVSFSPKFSFENPTPFVECSDAVSTQQSLREKGGTEAKHLAMTRNVSLKKSDADRHESLKAEYDMDISLTDSEDCFPNIRHSTPYPVADTIPKQEEHSEDMPVLEKEIPKKEQISRISLIGSELWLVTERGVMQVYNPDTVTYVRDVPVECRLRGEEATCKVRAVTCTAGDHIVIGCHGLVQPVGTTVDIGLIEIDLSGGIVKIILKEKVMDVTSDGACVYGLFEKGEVRQYERLEKRWQLIRCIDIKAKDRDRVLVCGAQLVLSSPYFSVLTRIHIESQASHVHDLTGSQGQSLSLHLCYVTPGNIVVMADSLNNRLLEMSADPGLQVIRRRAYLFSPLDGLLDKSGRRWLIGRKHKSGFALYKFS